MQSEFQQLNKNPSTKTYNHLLEAEIDETAESALNMQDIMNSSTEQQQPSITKPQKLKKRQVVPKTAEKQKVVSEPAILSTAVTNTPYKQRNI